jgi:hypothetical protein
MWPLNKADGPEPEITPEMALSWAVLVIGFWWMLNFFCPWMGTARTFPFIR